MDKRIQISEEAVNEIKNRMSLFLEETRSLLSNLERTIDNAEVMGWRDFRYRDFKERFESLSKPIKDSIREMEEDMLPELNILISSINEF